MCLFTETLDLYKDVLLVIVAFHIFIDTKIFTYFYVETSSVFFFVFVQLDLVSVLIFLSVSTSSNFKSRSKNPCIYTQIWPVKLILILNEAHLYSDV